MATQGRASRRSASLGATRAPGARRAGRAGRGGHPDRRDLRCGRGRRNARYCYLRWGAEAKVRQLEQLHPHLRERPTARFTAALDSPPEPLDTRTVVKASQALSSEMFLERLIEVLMRIAIEHAGADRGLLVLPHGEAQRIEAEATADRDRIKVRVRATDLTPLGEVTSWRVCSKSRIKFGGDVGTVVSGSSLGRKQ